MGVESFWNSRELYDAGLQGEVHTIAFQKLLVPTIEQIVSIDFPDQSFKHLFVNSDEFTQQCGVYYSTDWQRGAAIQREDTKIQLYPVSVISLKKRIRGITMTGTPEMCKITGLLHSMGISMSEVQFGIDGIEFVTETDSAGTMENRSIILDIKRNGNEIDYREAAMPAISEAIVFVDCMAISHRGQIISGVNVRG